MPQTATIGDVDTSVIPPALAVRDGGVARARCSKSAAIRIACSADKAYSFWRNLANLPLFMRTLESVEEPNTGTSIWKRRLPGGSIVTWEAELTCDFPGARIAWRSIDEEEYFDAGFVRFTPDKDGGRTEVDVTIEYEAALTPSARSVANLFRADPGAQLAEALMLLKFALESQMEHSEPAEKG